MAPSAFTEGRGSCRSCRTTVGTRTANRLTSGSARRWNTSSSQALPNREPWHVWPIFEFIADTGAVYEVDSLVLSQCGLWLMEIKSHPGSLRGDHQTWTFTHEGRNSIIDHPFPLANRKAKCLRSVLQNQARALKLKIDIPYIEPLIFCSARQLTFDLDEIARKKVTPPTRTCPSSTFRSSAPPRKPRRLASAL